MRKFIIIIMIAAILVVGYLGKPSSTEDAAKEYSFKDALDEVKEIEKKFNFDAGYPDSIEDKWSMLGYLNNIKNYVENLPKDEETNAIYNYILFRTKELDAKIKFQLAAAYKLSVMEDNTLICPQEEPYEKRMQYFNESVKLGYESAEHLKILINNYPKYFEMTKIEKITPKLIEAQYYQIEEDRKEEEKTVRGLCFG